MGDVVDMTGRVLAEGETVDVLRDEQFRESAMRTLWQHAPDLVRAVAEREGLAYSDAAYCVVHSILREAEQAMDRHEAAREVFEGIGRDMYGVSFDAQPE